MTTDIRLAVFQELVACCHNLYLWTYDSTMHLLSSSCPDAENVVRFIQFDSINGTLLDFVKNHTKPVIMTDTIGLMWLCSPEKDRGELRRIHVLGPFFTDDDVARQIGRRLRDMELEPSMSRQALAFLQSLPVISLNRIFEYGIMLHFCTTGERINVSELHYRKSKQKKIDADAVPEDLKIHGTYAAEQEMLRMVREGDLNYAKQMSRLSMTGNFGRLSKNQERNNKNLILVGITLFARAAIEGGVSPETALTLSDRYFQSVEDCRTMTELMEISTTMAQDYVERVHRRKQESGISEPIRSSMEHVELHLTEELSLKQLAELAGYSEYYFSKRFKKETGTTPKAFIQKKRLERAKFLLRTTQTRVQDISESLCFGSQSYFADVFRRAEGISPTAYREQFRNRTPAQN